MCNYISGHPRVCVCMYVWLSFTMFGVCTYVRAKSLLPDCRPCEYTPAAAARPQESTRCVRTTREQATWETWRCRRARARRLRAPAPAAAPAAETRTAWSPRCLAANLNIHKNTHIKYEKNTLILENDIKIRDHKLRPARKSSLCKTHHHYSHHDI